MRILPGVPKQHLYGLSYIQLHLHLSFLPPQIVHGWAGSYQQRRPLLGKDVAV